MQKVRVALIGHGHLGRFHAQKALSLPACECVAIVEPFLANQAKAKEAHPNVKVVSSVDEIMSEISAALVVTPTSLHFELVKKLIENKKHVFCEKPLTENSKEAEEIKKLAVKNPELVIQVGHSERCHEIWNRCFELENFFKGPANAVFTRVAPFKGRATDVDVVSDLMIHDIDLMLYLFKETPKSVEAKGYKMRTKKYDYACAQFSFESGKKATIIGSRNHTQEVRSFEITSSEGSLAVDLMRNELLIADTKATGPDDFVKKIPYNKRDHLLIEQEAFYDSILKKRPPLVSVDDGLKAIKIIDKVMESLEKGTSVSIN